MVAAAGILAACGKKDGEPAAGSNALVYCAGVNSCAAQSVRKYGKHACVAKNTCKGQGVARVTAEECRTKGGTVQPD